MYLNQHGGTVARASFVVALFFLPIEKKIKIKFSSFSPGV